MALLFTTPSTVKCACSTTRTANAIFTSWRRARIPGAPSVPPFSPLNNSFAFHFSSSRATPLSNALVTTPSIRHPSPRSNSFATPPDRFAAPYADPLVFTAAAAFSAGASRAVGYDRNSATWRVGDDDSKSGYSVENVEARASKASRKKALADPTGRRRKDRVPNSYELIGALEPILQKFMVYTNVAFIPFILFIGSKFVRHVLPEILSRGPYQSVFSVICANDYHFAISMVIPLYSCIYGLVRYFLHHTPSRVYLDRDTESYAVVYQGLLRAYPRFFTPKDVRMARAENKWWLFFFRNSNWLYLKGRGAALEPEIFKNVRDYNQMVRYARKYEDVH